jgi:hypothetical protein
VPIARFYHQEGQGFVRICACIAEYLLGNWIGKHRRFTMPIYWFEAKLRIFCLLESSIARFATT